MRLDSEIIKKRYNRLVQLYNSDDRTKEETLNLLSGNEERIRHRLEELLVNKLEDKEFFKAEMKGIVFDNLYAQKNEDSGNPYQDQKEIDLLDQIFEQLEFEVIETDSYIDQPEWVYKQLSDKINELYSYKGLDDQMAKPTTHISNIIAVGKSIKRIESELRAYEVVINKIIDDLFPQNLDRYGELSDSQRKELKSSSKSKGRKLSKSVPQDEVEDIVGELLEKYKNGVMVKAKFNGQVRAFKVVHDAGKYEGKANINQIFKYFEIAHPELINISDRQFKKRIKKAIPDDMK